MKKNIILLSIGVMALCGCTRDEANAPSAGEAVNFTAGIETLTRTTDGGDAWVVGDQVGIYMLTTGGNMATPADVFAENVQYNVTPATGALAPVSAPIYYPQSGTVDFAAYYPYGTVTAGVYNIDVTGQTVAPAQIALDVLYAKKTGVAKTQTAVGLVFDHVLSKVTLNVTLGEGLSALTGADVTAAKLGGMPLTATLDLRDGALTAGTTGEFVALKSSTPTAGSAATFTALVVPHTGAIGRTVTFTVDGATYTGTFPAENVFTKGKNHTYTVTVRRTGVNMGTQTIAPWTPDNGGSIGGSTTTGHYHNGYYYTAEAWRFIQWAQLTDEWKSAGFTLASDIDLTGFDWTPVGDNTTTFTKTFDGGGYAITGLSINRNVEYVGLFGRVGSGGKVQNVSVSGTVTGTGTVTSSGDMSYVGGIAGVNDGTITGCSFSGTVTGTGTGSYVGGIAGYNPGGTIIGCSVGANSTVEGSGSSVGGIAGRNFSGTITGCSVGANSTITDSGNTSYVGGIAGYNYNGTITGSWSAAKSVKGTGYVGGIAGYNQGGSITGCSVGANSTIEGTGSNSTVGGIAGYNQGGSITGCIAAPESVSGNSPIGVVAGNNSATVSTCFWSRTVTGATAPIGSGPGMIDPDNNTVPTTPETENGSFDADNVGTFFTTPYTLGTSSGTPIDLMNEAIAILAPTSGVRWSTELDADGYPKAVFP